MSDKIVPLSRLVERLRPLRDAGKRVALANGIFDILHAGHLRYLEGAKREADILVVGVNSDRSARELKGPERPIVPESDRMELIAGFECVDFVTSFGERTVDSLLRGIRPDVHCKGTDYTAESVPERDTARELGIRVAIVGDPKSRATRDLIRKIRSRPG